MKYSYRYQSFKCLATWLLLLLLVVSSAGAVTLKVQNGSATPGNATTVEIYLNREIPDDAKQQIKGLLFSLDELGSPTNDLLDVIPTTADSIEWVGVNKTFIHNNIGVDSSIVYYMNLVFNDLNVPPLVLAKAVIFLATPSGLTFSDLNSIDEFSP